MGELRHRHPRLRLLKLFCFPFLATAILYFFFYTFTPSHPRTALSGRVNPPDLWKRYHTAACMEFAYLRARPATRDAIDRGIAFVPARWGDTGNHLGALIRALFLCYIFGYRTVVISELALRFPRDFNTTDGIRVLLRAPDPLPSTYICVNSFEIDGAPECPLADVPIAATIRDAFVATLPNVTVNASTLYIHARGGDIMETNTLSWWHGQPPCHYFLDAMRMDNASQTVVMGNHDHPNPCIERLVAQGAVYDSSQGPWEDFARLVHAKRLVVSRSTFTMASMLFSKPKDVLYAFVTQYAMCIWEGHSRLNEDYDRFGAHHKCRATPEYDDKVLREWHATDEQLEIMKTIQKGCEWEYG
jgi:hypothetical protein